MPIHALDEFKALAPAESKTEEALANDHQSMLSRLGFELSERQRSVDCYLCSLRRLITAIYRLEEQRRSLANYKEAKMKDYREQEKLVTEWFAQGTGIELVWLALELEGIALKLSRPLPISRRPVARLRPAWESQKTGQTKHRHSYPSHLFQSQCKSIRTRYKPRHHKSQPDHEYVHSILNVKWFNFLYYKLMIYKEGSLRCECTGYRRWVAR